MSGETNQQPSAFTIDSLKVHIDQRLVDDEKAFAEYRLDMKDRFKEVNEFRKSLDDLGKNMQTKLEANALQKSNDDKFSEHNKQLAELRSRLDIGNPVVQTIQQQLANSQGQQQGNQLTMGRIYAALGAAVAVLGLIVALANGVFK